MRAVLLAIFVLGALGTAVELLLLEHTERLAQWVPLGLVACALVVLAWHALARGPASVRAFQVVMALFVAGGIAGVGLHYQGNVEFERELHPEQSGLALFRGAMMGAFPALAPGTMVLLGSIGLVYAYRHPALAHAGGRRPAATEEPT